MVGYFRDYVKNMSTRTKHLSALLKKGTPLLWTPAHEAEFHDLKDALTSPDTMLFHPDWNAPFEVHTDSSKHGCGAMLSQWHRGNYVQSNFRHSLLTLQNLDGLPHIRNYMQ